MVNTTITSKAQSNNTSNSKKDNNMENKNMRKNTPTIRTIALDMTRDELQKYPPISQEETLRLLSIAKSKSPLAVSARQKIILSNLRMVMKIAEKFCYNDDLVGDYFNEGVLGLNKAIDKYNPEQGVKFLSYAVRAIRSAMVKASEDTKCEFRLPHNIVKEITKVEKCISATLASTGVMPSNEKIAEVTGLRVKRVAIARSYMSSNIIRLDEVIDNDSKMTRLDKMVSETDTDECYNDDNCYEFTSFDVCESDDQVRLNLLLRVIAKVMNQKNADFYGRYVDLLHQDMVDKDIAVELNMTPSGLRKKLERIYKNVYSPRLKELFLRYAV